MTDAAVTLAYFGLVLLVASCAGALAERILLRRDRAASGRRSSQTNGGTPASGPLLAASDSRRPDGARPHLELLAGGLSPPPYDRDSNADNWGGW